MSYFFFYFFSASSVLSCLFAVFSYSKPTKETAVIVFLLSVSGIITLINGGFLAFTILILLGGYCSYESIKNLSTGSEDNGEEDNSPIHIFYILLISLIGALVASLTGSTIWQGNTYLQKEITLVSFAETIIIDYFIFIIVFIISYFLISAELNKVSD